MQTCHVSIPAATAAPFLSSGGIARALTADAAVPSWKRRLPLHPGNWTSSAGSDLDIGSGALHAPKGPCSCCLALLALSRPLLNNAYTLLPGPEQALTGSAPWP